MFIERNGALNFRDHNCRSCILQDHPRNGDMLDLGPESSPMVLTWQQAYDLREKLNNWLVDKRPSTYVPEPEEAHVLPENAPLVTMSGTSDPTPIPPEAVPEPRKQEQRKGGKR